MDQSEFIFTWAHLGLKYINTRTFFAVPKKASVPCQKFIIFFYWIWTSVSSYFYRHSWRLKCLKYKPMLVYFVIIKEKSTWGSHPVKKSFFMWTLSKEWGGVRPKSKLFKALFPAWIWTCSRGGGGLVDPNPNYVKALSWLNLDIMVKKGPCSCPRKQGGGGSR